MHTTNTTNTTNTTPAARADNRRTDARDYPHRPYMARGPAIPVLGFCRRGDGIATLTEMNRKP